ncbi:tetratricopeptide repeat protein [Haliangium sp.]|uniref:tetratricopeptide repeat protein n=1 Tax=Haliangium sp. TaxID=2663208 RepID=UPI003D0CDB31
MNPVLPPWIGVATRAHWRSRRLWLWALGLALVAVGLCFVPLLDRPGFGFAFVMALASAAAGLDLGAALVRRARAIRAAHGGAVDPAPHQVLVALLGRALATQLALLALPLLIICANGLRVQTCDWGFGLLAFALMPALSSALAAAVGVLVALALPTPTGRARWLVGAAPTLVLVATVLHSVWRFYAAPPVFSYNPFAGYFPGNLYDEQIDFQAAFYWARLTQFVTLTAALALASWCLDLPSLRLRRGRRPAGSRWRAGMLGLAALAATAGLWSQAGVLGFSVSTADIQRALGARYDSEHFTIYYPPGSDIERDIAAIAADHEFRYDQVVEALGAAPPGRITSFYFAGAEDKFRWMGARNVYMAKPWRGEIYLNHQRFPHPIVRHELVHAIAAVFGSPLFRVSAGPVLGLPLAFNVGLIEGTAVAADWPDHFTRALTPHQSVKAMQELGMAPPLEQVFSTGFFLFSSARSYTLAGSFVRYLLDRYGSERLREVYRRGGDFAEVYEKPRAALLAEWQAVIEQTPLPPRAAEMVRERFRRPGIFLRVCPHAIARARARAAERWIRGDPGGAIDILTRVCEQAPQEPHYRLELARYLVAAGDGRAGAEVYRALADDADNISSTLRAEALLSLADSAARAGDWAEVVALLDRAGALPIDEDLMRNVVAQRHAATHTGPAGPALRAYFWGHDLRLGADPMVLLGRAGMAVWAEPDAGLGHYLVGRNLRARGAPEESAAALERSLALGLPHPLIEREAARLLAEAAYLAGLEATVERAAALLDRPGQPEVTRLLGRDWRERLRWRRTDRARTTQP